MSLNDPAWRRFPVLRALFQQWRTARGSAPPGTHQKPFRRNWEVLLEDAGLVSGEARREADRDARTLAEAGLVELKLVRYRPYQIESIRVPLSAEPRLRSLFADELPIRDSEPLDLSTVEWHPELAFIPSLRPGIAAADLLKLNTFLSTGRTNRMAVPIKERSLEIFGDEKRLDALRTTSLFAEGRLRLDQLGCFIVAQPLGWRRGPCADGPLIVLENAATWDSYCRWNAVNGCFSGVIYGGGNRFMDCVTRLGEIFEEVGGSRRVLYFGDIDPQGLRIPQIASRRGEQYSLPRIEADVWSYSLLLELGTATVSSEPDDFPQVEVYAWLGELAQPTRAVIERGMRIAQEHVGWNQLATAERGRDLE